MVELCDHLRRGDYHSLQAVRKCFWSLRDDQIFNRLADLRLRIWLLVLLSTSLYALRDALNAGILSLESDDSETSGGPPQAPTITRISLQRLTPFTPR